MKKMIIAILLLAIVAAIVVSQVVWLRVWRATVVCDGSVIESARVYRSPGGDLLIDLLHDPLYVYVVRGKGVGIAQPSSIFEVAPFIIARHSPLPLVALGTEKTGAVDPRLSVTPRTVSFVNQDGKTIQVKFK